MEPLRLLHLSDLHVRADTDVETLVQPLVADLRDREGGLGFDRIDHLVVSGDLTNRASVDEFRAAHALIARLCDALAVPHAACLVVPGNHDVNWDEEVYRYKPRRQVDARHLAPGTFKEQADGYLVRDDAAYPNRLRNFSEHFHAPFFGAPYPLDAAAQFTILDGDGVQLLGLDSAWQIDEHFRERSAIHDGALSRALDAIARSSSSTASSPAVRVAVWHHPVTGNEKIVDDAFLGRLRTAGFRMCLHGHVHEDRTDLVGYLHPRQLHVGGAGSFGAPASERPESTPRLYNLVELDVAGGRARVHTRCLRRGGGAWEGWAVWPGASPGERRTFYEIPLAPTTTAPAVDDAGFDVFVSYDERDRAAAIEVARALQARGLRPWLDVWDVRPGTPWLRALEDAIPRVRAAAILVGVHGIARDQDLVLRGLLDQFVTRGCPIVPLQLAVAGSAPRALPPLFAGFHAVDQAADPAWLDALVFGITGRR